MFRNILGKKKQSKLTAAKAISAHLDSHELVDPFDSLPDELIILISQFVKDRNAQLMLTLVNRRLNAIIHDDAFKFPLSYTKTGNLRMCMKFRLFREMCQTIRNNDLERFKKLLSLGIIDVNYVAPPGAGESHNLLFNAMDYRRCEFVEYLLKQGATLDDPDTKAALDDLRAVLLSMSALPPISDGFRDLINTASRIMKLLEYVELQNIKNVHSSLPTANAFFLPRPEVIASDELVENVTLSKPSL